MFGLFGKKAKNKKFVVESASRVLKLQLDMSRSVGPDKFKDKSMDKFFHGYIFGFIDSLIQLVEIADQREGLAIMEAVHECIFYKGVGQKVLEFHLDAQMEPIFLKGALKGGKEARDWLGKEEMPMGLSNFICDDVE